MDYRDRDVGSDQATFVGGPENETHNRSGRAHGGAKGSGGFKSYAKLILFSKNKLLNFVMKIYIEGQ